MNYANSVKPYMQTLNIENVYGMKVDDVYNDYIEWCKENDYWAFSKIGFSRAMRGKFDNLYVKHVWMNGKLTGVYVNGFAN